MSYVTLKHPCNIFKTTQVQRSIVEVFHVLEDDVKQCGIFKKTSGGTRRTSY